MLYNFIENQYISPLSAATAAVALLLGILYYLVKYKGVPPGPIGLPILGYFPFLRKDCHIQLEDLGKKYGDVFSFTSTGHTIINLGTVKLIREALVTKSECFGGRYQDFTITGYAFGDGVAFANGEKWKVNRKFFLQMFREYGLTALKTDAVGPIYDNVHSTVEELRAKKGEAVFITDIMTEKCTTVMRQMLFGDDDASLKESVQEIIDQYGIVMDGMAGWKLFLIGTIGRYLVFPFVPGFSDTMAAIKRIEDILYKIINRHKSTFDEDHIRDVIDSYIKEKRERQRKGDPTAEYFTDSSLKCTLMQFIGDGVTTLAFFIGTFFQTLMEHPEEQGKIYEELMAVVGPNRQPTIEDKSNLPYTNAFILEVTRTTDFFPIIPTMECTKETTLRGYRIPKGAITLNNMWSAHHDPKVFDEPYKFNPYRYIAEPGKPKAELPVLFGIGKRMCIGEIYCMTQLFLFLTTIVKNFRLTLPKDSKGSASIFMLTEKLQVCAIPRVEK